MTQKEYIIHNVKNEFENCRLHVPLEWSIYIFLLPSEGLILYHDTSMPDTLLRELINERIIKLDGLCYHQGCSALRYKFIGYKYPPDYYRSPSPKLRKSIYERDNYRCLHCGSERKLTIDHITPWSYGGRTNYDNLQTLCRSCNSIKHNN